MILCSITESDESSNVLTCSLKCLKFNLNPEHNTTYLHREGGG